MISVPNNSTDVSIDLKNIVPLEEETSMLMMFHCFMSLQASVMMEHPYLV